MQPIVDRLEEDYGEQMKFVQLDANNEGKEAFKLGNFLGHPAYLIMQPDGKEVWRKFGVVTYEDIETAIQEALG
jgi:hypothetical protein